MKSFNINNVSGIIKWYAVDTIAAVKADLALARHFGDGKAVTVTEQDLREIANRASDVFTHINEDELEYIYRTLATEIPHQVDLGTPITF